MYYYYTEKLELYNLNGDISITCSHTIPLKVMVNLIPAISLSLKALKEKDDRGFVQMSTTSKCEGRCC